MKTFLKMLMPIVMLASCAKEGTMTEVKTPEMSDPDVAVNEMIVLGDKLENPYSLSNVSAVMASLYPTKAELAPTDLYVRFLPKDSEQMAELEALNIPLFDHPLDYELKEDGDYYHDPSLPSDEITWQYAVVKPDFIFPEDIDYQVLDKCFIPDEAQTRAFSDVDWDAVEREAFKKTGNAKLLAPETKSKAQPEGKITIVDDKLKKTIGVSGVHVYVNSFTKIASAFTDKYGKYSISKKFSSNPYYKLYFKNERGFTIGLNAILVQASISSLGKGPSDGLDLKIDKYSDNTLFRRCVVNNAAYDYLTTCDDEGLDCPPSNLRFWILNFTKPSGALMLHQGAMISGGQTNNYLGAYAMILRIFLPDIIIGSKGNNTNYAELYSSTIHEMAHATHFTKVGGDYWGKLGNYILTSFMSASTTYGNGVGELAGYCEVAEMWAYFVENTIFTDRYGYNPNYGTKYWFFPQIFSTLLDSGMTMSDICSALNANVTDRDELKASLKEIYPSKRTVIDLIFDKYER